MTLRPNELREVAEEIARALAGSPLQKVVQPDERTLRLGFPRRWLEVVLDPRHGRVLLLDGKPAGTGEAAPAFCMLARKELVGARLVAVEAVAGERAARLRFARGDGERALVVLLYGAGARLLLVDGEGRVLGAIGARKGASALPAPRASTGEEAPSRFSGESPSARIAAHYAVAARETAVADARRQALAEADRAIERLRRKEAALAADLARGDAAANRRKHADLLLAHLAEVPRGASEVTLPDDFTDGSPVAIPLDPARSPRDNAMRLYKEHQRMHRGRRTVLARLAETEREREAAEAARARLVEQPADALPPPSLRGGPAGTGRAAAASDKGLAPSPSGARPGPRPPYHRFRSSTGAEIWVGRGAAKNDELTFHCARGDDLWLHTRDVPGAHVVVPRPGKVEVDGETLLDAATLAVHHSPARDEAQADVTYVARKLVRKPRGAPPGRVSVAGGKTLRLRMEPARLQRLLATKE